MGTGLHAIEPAKVSGGLGEGLLKTARFCVESDSPVVAYAVVALHEDGTTDVGGKVIDASPFPRYMFIGHCTEVLRDHFITDETARSIVNRAIGWED